MVPALRRVLADRIYYGWLVAIACFLASMAVFGTSYAFGVFYEAFIETFTVSRTSMAAAFGLQTALLYVVGVGAGQLVDAYGQRRVAAGSGAVLTVGLCLTALARTYAELLVAFGVVSAVGMAGLYVVGYASIPLWFERRRGAAAGLASAGLGLGLVVVPPITNRLIAAFGWRAAMFALAGAVGVVCALLALLFADQPGDVGADPSVEFGGDDQTGSAERAAGDPTSRDRPTNVRDVLSSTPFLLVFVGWTLLFAPLYVVLSHVVLHATAVGFGRAVGVLSITIVGVTTTGARVVVGVLSDRFGRTTTFAASGALLGIATMALVAAPTATVYLEIFAVFGVAYGGCGGLLGPVIADLFGEERLNTLFAAASLSLAVAGLTAPPVAGFLFERLGSYTPALILTGTLGVCGAGCVVLAGRVRS